MVTGVGLSVICIISCVETVVYTIFTAISLIPYCCTDKPYKFSTNLLKSSFHTIPLTLKNIIFNLLFEKLLGDDEDTWEYIKTNYRTSLEV